MSQENETNESKKMSDSIGKLAEALSKAQGAMAAASKDASNPFFNKTYASLASIWDCVRKPLADNQLSVIQTTSKSVNSITINTLLVHASGEWISGELSMTPTKNDPQGVGSAITYARRYALSAIVGVSAEDDDAEGAIDRSKPPAGKAAISPPKRKSELEGVNPEWISQDERLALVSAAQVANVGNEKMSDFLKSKNIKSSREIKKSEYETIMKWVKSCAEEAA